MYYKNSKKNYIFLIFLLLLIVGLFTGCEQGTGNKFSVLGFLPSGMKTATGNKILYNTDYRVYALIPVVEPLFGWFISALCNIFDFFLWFITWVPGIKQVTGFIYSLPDMDQHAVKIFCNHRNFITHSVLNPGFIIITLFSFILSKIGKCKELGECILGLSALIFSLHFFADSMPLDWKGFALIHISILKRNLFTLPPLLSKIWLILNAFLALKIWNIAVKDS